MTKTCTKCKQEKPLTEYQRDKSKKDGYYSSCKACCSLDGKARAKKIQAWRRTRYAEDEEYRERVLERNKKYVEENKERLNQYWAEYWRTRTDKKRMIRLKWLLKTRYGLTVEEYYELLEHQEGRCAICGDPAEWGAFRLGVDHDHDTLLVRGLLCNPCNTRLERGDDIHPEQASAYLDHPPAVEVLGYRTVPVT